MKYPMEMMSGYITSHRKWTLFEFGYVSVFLFFMNNLDAGLGLEPSRNG